MESIVNVENLFVDYETSKFWRPSDYKIEFPRLKSMKLGDLFEDSKLFAAFQNVQLQLTELIFVRADLQPEMLDNEFVHWFSGQTQLKSLECYNVLAKFIMTMSPNRNFNLKKIKFNCNWNLPNAEDLIDFFKYQDELEECEVDLDGAVSINAITLKSLLVIESLKKLQISFFQFRNTTNGLKANNSVETYIINTDRYYTDAARLIELLSNLKHFECKEAQYFDSILEKLSINCPLLEIIKIRKSLTERYICLLRRIPEQRNEFLSLKELNLTNILTINNTSSIAFWRKMTIGSPLMEILTIHCFDLSEVSLNYMCTNWQRFTTLTLGCGAYTRVLRDILSKSDSFSTLIISPVTFRQFDFEHVPYRVEINADLQDTRNEVRSLDRIRSLALGSSTLFDNVCDFRPN